MSLRTCCYSVLLAYGWALAPGASLLAEDVAAPTRPNVVVVCADDHAAYVCGAYGNRLARTPAIDRLAAGGLRFARAYCNSPVCTASRQSFLTGRYPRTIGVTRLETPLPESETTLAELFSAAGYRTAAIGKMHFNSDLKHGFAERIDDPSYRAHLREHPLRPLPVGLEVQPAWKPFRDPAAVWLNAAALPYGARDDEMQGSYFARCAEEFLTSAEARQPFFLMVSFYEPHSPFRFPIEMAGSYRPELFIAPPCDPGEMNDAPAIFRELSDEQKQGIQAAYYTSVEFVDRNVGRVLASLSQAGLDESTIVVYLSDHGYMLGQHGRFEKHCMYEPAVQAPLVIRVPHNERAGAVCEAPVELIDLAPTLLELCGLPRGERMQGQSLVPALRGEEFAGREDVIVEYAPNDELMILRGAMKLIYERGVRRRTDGYDTERPLPGRRIRLFDLESDPDEQRDLAAAAEQQPLIADLLQRLADHVVQTARRPEQVPAMPGIEALLDWGAQPRDVNDD
ncbi:MAG: sulfatase-like hydrolase/transferase [Pirellulales bacterium]|nr:sulfatase-like hydrolase/transferase [Pirellulales bacterium]